MDTLGYLLTLVVTPADEQDRAQVEALAQQVQEVTGELVEVAFVEDYTGKQPAEDAQAQGIRLEVVKLSRKEFVLLPRRWVVERTFGWMPRFRRLVRDYERLPETLAGFHLIAFAALIVKCCVEIRFQGYFAATPAISFDNAAASGTVDKSSKSTIETVKPVIIGAITIVFNSSCHE